MVGWLLSSEPHKSEIKVGAELHPHLELSGFLGTRSGGWKSAVPCAIGLQRSFSCWLGSLSYERTPAGPCRVTISNVAASFKASGWTPL